MSFRPFGVIEGFYGDPWSQPERIACIDALATMGANAYVWAPKSEPRHRDAWRDSFTSVEIANFAALIRRNAKVSVSVALTPGNDASVADVVAKLQPVVDAGCRIITLCFDDLPVLDAAERHRTIANGVRAETGVDVWLVPTHYAGVSGSRYLDSLMDGLHPGVLVMWTGVCVVNDSITGDETARRAAACAGRAPLVWDNVPVNDAMMTGFLHIGPYQGREHAVARESAGLLLNPMVSMSASLPMIESACAWWHGGDATTAWEISVERAGLRTLAEATSYPGDAHWPGERPSRGWLQSVKELVETGDPDIDPWVAAARGGAGIALAAMDMMDAIAEGKRASDLTRLSLPLIGLRDWLRNEARTLGAGPRTRPVFTQDGTGRFAVTGGAVTLTRSIPEALVSDAFAALAAIDQEGL
jgi:hypothetical protein